MNTKSEYLLKITIIGNSYKLIDQFVRNYADDKFDKNGPAYQFPDQICTKKMVVKDTQTKLILQYRKHKPFDSRQETAFYRGSSACLIIFDKSDRESFEKVTDLLEDFRKYIPSPDIPVAILGINTDSEDVSTDEGKALADLLDIPYFETSSPKFENVGEVFVCLCEKVIK